MSLRSIGYTVLVGLLLLGAVSLVVGSILGQPILLSYVETGSMEPTLEPGDGFVAIPAELAGTIDEGDVIAFEAEEIRGGGITTHRVVRETKRGYITKGDANPFTDQDGKEPPVKRTQIVAEVLQFDGQVVVIPGVGFVAEGTQSALSIVQRQLAATVGSKLLLGTQGLAYLFFMLTIAWYIVGEIRSRNSKRRFRVTSKMYGIDTRMIVGVFTAILVVGATAAMVLPAGTQEYSVVSADFDSERPTVIPKGESKRVQYVVDNGGLLPVVSFLEPASEGVDVEPREVAISGHGATNATVTLKAPPETGYYRRYVTEHRYLKILPQSTIRALYELHPWAPIVIIDAVIAVPFYVLGVRLVGRGRLRRRSRESSESVLVRVRSVLTGLY